MSLIQKNIDLRMGLTSSISNGHGIPGSSVKVEPAKRVLNAYEAEQHLFGIAYKQPGMPTLDDCKEVFLKIHNTHGSVYSNTILSRFGIWRIQDLTLIVARDFWLYCMSVIVYGAKPFYGWSLQEIPDRVRERWLLWHPESDWLWEVHGQLAGELDSGEVSDVTGIPEYEHMFIERNEEL